MLLCGGGDVDRDCVVGKKQKVEYNCKQGKGAKGTILSMGPNKLVTPEGAALRYIGVHMNIGFKNTPLRNKF